MNSPHWSENILFVDPEPPKKRGGARPGAGQPSKHGEKTKAVRIPESIAAKMDLIIAIPELQKLLDDFEVECNSSNSPRYYHLKKALGEIRSLGF